MITVAARAALRETILPGAGSRRVSRLERRGGGLPGCRFPSAGTIRAVTAPSAVPLLDLTRYDETLKAEIDRAVAEVFASGRFVLGPALDAFEHSLAERLGVRHAIGVSSGTDALLVALMALGVGPGDEVVTSPFSFFASAGVVARLGARPVFVDIDPETYCLDPDRLEAAITPAHEGVEPVYLYGQCADMAEIVEIARRRGVPVLEDACQAIGATYGGRAAGALGTLAGFSFYPTKNLGAAGDAGAVTTDDDESGGAGAHPARARRPRDVPPRAGRRELPHGRDPGGGPVRQAAAPRRLERETPRDRGAVRRAPRRRRENRPSRRGPGPRARLPPVRRARRRNRDAVRKRLTERRVATSVFYPVPLHLQECFAELGGREGDFPEAERASREVLALPMFAELTDAEVERVAEACWSRWTRSNALARANAFRLTAHGSRRHGSPSSRLTRKPFRARAASSVRHRYSPRMPSDRSWTPEKNASATMSDVQPCIGWPWTTL